MEIKGKYFLVTGAASGLGLATAKRLLAGGAHVLLSDVSADIGRTLETLGPNAKGLQGDVRSEVDMERAIEAASGDAGLHGVIHCAGVAETEFLLDAEGNPASLVNYQRIIDINLVGTFNVLRLAAARMRNNPVFGSDNERGVIVTVASVCAFDGGAGQVGYGASKAGVVGMTLPAARELGNHGIRVVTVAPGPFATAMLADKPSDRLQASAQATPFPRRLGQAEDFALLAEQIIVNVMLNGETIRLDGGIRLR
ncbi:SDR family NAD(P)-dependent oxidoreductase [Pseudomonas asiatica]|uniref:SDR family NAD(P)-dependent oxidoreductase n=1 Tax=Pseudomonas asiatica TaxID=2219225 RepID=UPI002E7AB9A7|nr:SDR family NAD(P)-dependent oxidoreductase [Pseudomonas asiatica]MEE1916310.1 SDR family NAD(P)-dependent oxidoreductase [Pseudomonas asiatica]